MFSSHKSTLKQLFVESIKSILFEVKQSIQKVGKRFRVVGAVSSLCDIGVVREYFNEGFKGI